MITDEVYEHIVYAPHTHVYFASLPGMAQRTLSCSSLSKTYSITGWRLGYIIASPEIIDTARKVHDLPYGGRRRTAAGGRCGWAYAAGELLYLADGKSTPTCGSCSAMAWNTWDCSSYVRRERIMCWWTLEHLAGRTTWPFARHWPGKLAWAPCLAPASSGEDVRNLIRLHFAKRDETLLEALNRLENIGKLKK